MICRIFLLFLALAPLNSSLQAGVLDSISCYFCGQNRPAPPAIRVLILHDAEGANLQIQGRKYSLFDPYTNCHLSTRFAGKCRYIHAAADGLRWGESFPGLYQLRIQPEDKNAFMTIDGYNYDGPIDVYDIGGTISIVNQISIEEYVRAMMVSFQGVNLESETLAALAIVIRTNAYYQAMNPKNTFWTVDGKKVGFQGVVCGGGAAQDAVKQTRYMIMSRTCIYEGGATPFPAQMGERPTGLPPKDLEVSKITLEEANAIAQRGGHAAQILAKAFPGSMIMLMQYCR